MTPDPHLVRNLRVRRHRATVSSLACIAITGLAVIWIIDSLIQYLKP